jgi:hypothetical protein
MAFGYILWSVWYIFPILVYCTKTNLATLVRKASRGGPLKAVLLLEIKFGEFREFKNVHRVRK